MFGGRARCGVLCILEGDGDGLQGISIISASGSEDWM
jgi:hypothetical protein